MSNYANNYSFTISDRTLGYCVSIPHALRHTFSIYLAYILRFSAIGFAERFFRRLHKQFCGVDQLLGLYCKKE